jgi:hypothetical protein
MVYQDSKVLRVFRVPRDAVVSVVRKVNQVPRAPAEQWALRVSVVFKELADILDPRDQLVRRGLRVLRVFMDLKVFRALRETQAQPVLPVLKDQKDSKVLLV